MHPHRGGGSTKEEKQRPSVRRPTGIKTSGQMESFWTRSMPPLLSKPLTHDLTADAVVIGGGIGGMTTAYLLSKQHQQTVLIEDGAIGSGETGRTTAHIASALDEGYAEIERLFGVPNSRLAAQSHAQAIDQIEAIIGQENIACDFSRVDGYLFSHPTDTAKTLAHEFEAATRAGIPVEKVKGTPVPSLGPKTALRFPDQAQFHPLKYLRGLFDAIQREGGQVYTQTHAHDIGDDHVTTSDGYVLKAHHIVVATNTPVHLTMTMHTKQAPYRSYVIAGQIPKSSVPAALYWGTRDAARPAHPYHYIRTQPLDAQTDVLLIGGEDHKTGQPENPDPFERLAEWARSRFPMLQDIEYKWSGQLMESIDALGFLGKEPGHANRYMITGDSGNGMTHGTIGAMLIRDQIIGKRNPFEQLYDPSRKTLSAATRFLAENLNVAAQYADWLKGDPEKHLHSLAVDEAVILHRDKKPIAVYKDREHVLHAYSAVCPHLQCIVNWNSTEKTFDCPCHGSRFTSTGKVINGPANTDLPKIDVR